MGENHQMAECGLEEERDGKCLQSLISFELRDAIVVKQTESDNRTFKADYQRRANGPVMGQPCSSAAAFKTSSIPAVVAK